MSERTLTFDELVAALAEVGDESGGDCRFEPMCSADPDHHGPEFAEAIWGSIERDRREVAELVRGIKP